MKNHKDSKLISLNKENKKSCNMLWNIDLALMSLDDSF